MVVGGLANTLFIYGISELLSFLAWREIHTIDLQRFLKYSEHYQPLNLYIQYVTKL